ncbi:hypothetical protein ACEPAG_8383 [Sanghuangporus baumii]
MASNDSRTPPARDRAAAMPEDDQQLYSGSGTSAASMEPNEDQQPSFEANAASRGDLKLPARPKASFAMLGQTLVSRVAAPMQPLCNYRKSISKDWLIRYQIVAFAILFIVLIVALVPAVVKSKHVPIIAGVDRKGFSKGPDTRGTINIILSCLSTIFTCSYALLYSNVSQHQESLDQPFFRSMYSSIRTFVSKTPGLLLNAAVPEHSAYTSVSALLHAREYRTHMQEKTDFGRQWTLRHQFYADIRGFKISVEENTDQNIQSMQNQTPRALEDAATDAITPKSAEGFLTLVLENRHAFAKINLEQVGLDIDDRGKGGFAKVVAVIQSCGIIIRCIARRVENQPVSPLEVTTCSYLACSFFSAVCLYGKPYGAKRHILLDAKVTRPRRLPTRDKIFILKDRMLGTLAFNSSMFRKSFLKLSSNEVMLCFVLGAAIIGGIVGAIIGAIHSLLWNSMSFPDERSREVWRVCCGIQIFGPLLTSFFLTIPDARSQGIFDWNKKYDGLFIGLACVSFFIHIGGRVMLLVISFYSFLSLPAHIYDETAWRSWIPHID